MGALDHRRGPRAGATLALTATPFSAPPDGVVMLTLRYGNAGELPVGAAALSLTLEPDLIPLANDGTPRTTPLIWSLGQLHPAADESLTLRLRLAAGAQAGQQLRATATLTADAHSLTEQIIIQVDVLALTNKSDVARDFTANC